MFWRREKELEPGELRTEIDRLAAAPRSVKTDRKLLELRHQLGVQMLENPPENPQHPEPADLPESDGLPEYTRDQLTPELIRAGILRDGCVLVRGLVDRQDALNLAQRIDKAYEVREGTVREKGLYEEFETDPRYTPSEEIRPWVRAGGGLLGPDSPALFQDYLSMLAASGFPKVLAGYLGEPPLLTLEKTTLRKAEPEVAGAWHQDGKFMGDVRALNLWLSLSRCGDEAPGLDIVPRRVPEFVLAGNADVMLDYVVTDETASRAAGDKQIIRPIFEPGDALLFDDLFLHKTGSDPSMPNPRYAVESWFFGASAFPEYAPVAV